jgi:hypothetical protein
MLGFKAKWNQTEVRLLNILTKPENVKGIELEQLRQELAGQTWLKLSKIPAPVDSAITGLVKSGFAKKTKKLGKTLIVPEDEVLTLSDDANPSKWVALPHTAKATTATVNPKDPVHADVVRIRDNKVFRTVVETDAVSATKFIKHLTEVATQIQELIKEPVYVSWNGVKYVVEDGKLKTANQAVLRFQERVQANYTAQAGVSELPGIRSWKPFNNTRLGLSGFEYEITDLVPGVSGVFMMVGIADAKSMTRGTLRYIPAFRAEISGDAGKNFSSYHNVLFTDEKAFAHGVPVVVLKKGLLPVNKPGNLGNPAFSFANTTLARKPLLDLLARIRETGRARNINTTSVG